MNCKCKRCSAAQRTLNDIRNQETCVYRSESSCLPAPCCCCCQCCEPMPVTPCACSNAY